MELHLASGWCWRLRLGEGSASRTLFSIAPWCVAHCIYNVTYIIIVSKLELKQGVHWRFKDGQKASSKHKRANQIKLTCTVSHHMADFDFLQTTLYPFLFNFRCQTWKQSAAAVQCTFTYIWVKTGWQNTGEYILLSYLFFLCGVQTSIYHCVERKLKVKYW